jgi:hypothetical protein
MGAAEDPFRRLSSYPGTPSIWPTWHSIHGRYRRPGEEPGTEVGHRGATVNAVAPGIVEGTQSLDPVNSVGVDGVAAAGRANLAGRVGGPDDGAVLYRCLTSRTRASSTASRSQQTAGSPS